jgi:acyl-CoA synthetase (AMP-forming)/AMP-acid ligase II
VPSRVVVVDALPLTGSGKIDRPALRGELGNREGDGR